MSKHACQTNHTIVWENSRLITTNPQYLQRRCLVRWYINSVPTLLNHDDGGVLSEVC